MMAYIVKGNWESFLRHSITLVAPHWETVAYMYPSGIDGPLLKPEVDDWLEMNVGYTKDSPWHRDQWHPLKPKFLFLPSLYHPGISRQWACVFKFFEEEDAMAFKLAWL